MNNKWRNRIIGGLLMAIGMAICLVSTIWVHITVVNSLLMIIGFAVMGWGAFYIYK